MLDDGNVLRQRDPHGALAIAASEWKQATYEATVLESEHDGRALTKVVVAGMGGSALAALLAKSWLSQRLMVPLEVVQNYDLPHYVDRNTLVITCSYSGNTEETLSVLQQAREKSAQLAVLASGGRLLDVARHQSVAYVALPGGIPQRMAMLYMLRGMLALLVNFGVLPMSVLDEVSATAAWLEKETARWLPSVTTDKNEAKQLALLAVGKTPVFYGGALTNSLAYKWKTSWNENAKNVAFWNEYPECSHNEFIGWTSHPVEKPFAVFDLVSSFEHPQIAKRFEMSDRLLSGKRPKANPIQLRGDTLIAQLLWGCILADFASIYAAVINNVDPTPVALTEKLKVALA